MNDVGAMRQAVAVVRRSMLVALSADATGEWTVCPEVVHGLVPHQVAHVGEIFLADLAGVGSTMDILLVLVQFSFRVEDLLTFVTWEAVLLWCLLDNPMNVDLHGSQVHLK